MNKNKPAAQVAPVVTKQCYKFVENVKIGNDLFVKGECIRLEESELELFGPYVTKCNGNKQQSTTGDCLKC